MRTERFLVPTVIVLLFVHACASEKDALTSDMARLKKEISGLRDEQSRLRARNEEMKDEILLIRAKVKRHQEILNGQGMVSNLPVIKIKPSAVASSEDQTPVDEPRIRVLETASNDTPEDDAAPRPILKLRGAGGARSALASGAAASTFDGLDRESHNLGTVDLPPLPGAAEGENLAEASEFDTAYRHYSNKRYAEALRLFASAVAGASSVDEKARARFWMGETYVAMRSYLAAIGEFERLLNKHPEDPNVPSALFRLGWSHEQLGDFEKAKHYYFTVVEKYPDSPAAHRALSRLKARGEDVMRRASL